MRFVIAFAALAVLTPSCGRDGPQSRGTSANAESPSAAAPPPTAGAQASAPPASSASASAAPTSSGAPSASSITLEEPKTVSIVSYSQDGEHPALISRCVEIVFPSSTPTPVRLGGSVGGIVSAVKCAQAVKWEPYAICAGMKLAITFGKPPAPIPPATTHYFHIAAVVNAAVERSCRDAGGAWTLTEEGRRRQK